MKDKQNMLYFFIALVLVIGIFKYLMNINNEKHPNTSSKTKTDESVKKNAYIKMRNLALTATAEQLELKDIDNEKVFGLISEMNLDNGTITIVAFLTGDASIYLSSGGGFIGSGTHPDINKKIKEIIKNIDKFKYNARKVNKVKLPSKGEITFNLLTKNGIYQIREKEEKVISKKSEYFELFEKVNNIINLIRKKVANKKINLIKRNKEVNFRGYEGLFWVP